MEDIMKVPNIGVQSQIILKSLESYSTIVNGIETYGRFSWIAHDFP